MAEIHEGQEPGGSSLYRIHGGLLVTAKILIPYRTLSHKPTGFHTFWSYWGFFIIWAFLISDNYGLCQVNMKLSSTGNFGNKSVLVLSNHFFFCKITIFFQFFYLIFIVQSKFYPPLSRLSDSSSFQTSFPSPPLGCPNLPPWPHISSPVS